MRGLRGAVQNRSLESMEVPDWLVKWLGNVALSYAIVAAVVWVISWLSHKKEFRELRKEIREMKQQPTINVTQQLAVHGTSPNEDGNAVMSSTITRIESMPQAEYDKLRKEGKASDGVIYLTK